MSILLTGSTGFLGQVISKNFKGRSVFTLNRSEGNFICDLSKSSYCFNQSFDLVVHCAGKAHCIAKNDSERVSFFEVNVTGTKNLLKSLKGNVPRCFVFISSVAVYGLISGVNVNEEKALEAIDPYGSSKVQAEKLVSDWCRENDVICTILRLPLIVDKSPPGNFGAMLRGIKRGYYMNVGGGRAKKSMVLAQDVVEFIPRVAEIGGIYNLTDGYHPSFKEISDSVSKRQVFNLPLVIAKYLGKIGDITGNAIPINTTKILKMTSDLTFDDNKARMIGWNPRSVLEYIQKNNLFNEKNI